MYKFFDDFDLDINTLGKISTYSDEGEPDGGGSGGGISSSSSSNISNSCLCSIFCDNDD